MSIMNGGKQGRSTGGQPRRLAAAAVLLAASLTATDDSRANSAGPGQATTGNGTGGDGTAGTTYAGVLTLLVQNDIFAGVDQQYTNGTYLRYTTRPNDLPALGRFLRRQAEGFVDAKDWRMTFGIGQSMFTPDDITDPNPPPDDRPYAGFLFGTVAITANTGQFMQTLALDIGLVGPPSLAEQTQKLVHQVIGDDPKGWDTQLGTEVAFRFLYEGAARYGADLPAHLGGLEVDVIPGYAAALGTVDISALGYLTVRIGSGLDIDFGPPRVRRSIATMNSFHRREELNWYLFATVEGQLVGRNLFLDGNTFSNSRSVDSNPTVGSIQLGGTIDFESWALSYTHIFRSKEFSTQRANPQFGSLALRLKF
jgi:lipid A 3-O-deacylase